MAEAPAVLTGKTVLVTGGTGKLGSAFAGAMAAAGADVVITGRQTARLLETAAAIGSQTGREVRHAAGDLTDRAGLADLAACMLALIEDRAAIRAHVGVAS